MSLRSTCAVTVNIAVGYSETSAQFHKAPRRHTREGRKFEIGEIVAIIQLRVFRISVCRVTVRAVSSDIQNVPFIVFLSTAAVTEYLGGFGFYYAVNVLCSRTR
jgi:hypothetical protein